MISPSRDNHLWRTFFANFNEPLEGKRETYQVIYLIAPSWDKHLCVSIHLFGFRIGSGKHSPFGVLYINQLKIKSCCIYAIFVCIIMVWIELCFFFFSELDNLTFYYTTLISLSLTGCRALLSLELYCYILSKSWL